jgi:hypothetical protein
MGRKRIPNLEVEYAQEREIKDLKQQIENLKKQLRDLQKNDTTKQEKPKPTKAIEKACPDCGASLKEIEVAGVGTIELCSKACGYKIMRKKK